VSAAGAATEVASVPVTLVKGDDPALVAQAAHTLVEQLVGADDPSLVVEEFGGPGTDELDVGAVIDACTTPPFLVSRRVVVVRDVGKLAAADARRLADYLKDPLPTTALVLLSGGGKAVATSLSKAVTAAGRAVDTSVGRTGRDRSQWLADHFRAGPVRLDPAAQKVAADHLGSDMGRLAGLLDMLAAAYGPGASVSVAELEPFLGHAGSLAPWDLTDAIDAGETATALAVLHRLLAADGGHPLVVMANLHRHYRQMLRLDGADVISAEQAAEVLGIHSYPAKKVLAQTRRMGAARIAQAIALLAEADLGLRGTTLLPGETVLEILVARLARLVRQGR
jgi:DNA polymerase-3 subunit delta